MNETRLSDKAQCLRGQYLVHDGRAYRIGAVIKTNQIITLGVRYVDRKEEEGGLITLHDAWEDRLAKLEDLHPDHRGDLSDSLIPGYGLVRPARFSPPIRSEEVPE